MGLPLDAARHCTYADYLGWPDDVRCELLVVCDMSKLSERGVRGAPDWVMEVVSPSNAAHDILTKRGLHERAGVREFWLVHPVDRVLTVHTLGADGLYGRSHLQMLEGQTELAVLPGVRIDWGELRLPVLPAKFAEPPRSATA